MKPIYGRWLLPLALVAAGAILTAPSRDSGGTAEAQAVPTIAIAIDDFESPDWPTDAPWSIPVDPEDPRTERYQWAPRTCRASEGDHGLWAVGGGTLGSQLECGESYPAGIRSVAILSLDLRPHEGATVLNLAFDLWGDTISDAALGDFFTVNYLRPTPEGFPERVTVIDWTGATGPNFRTERLDLLDLTDLFNPNRRFNLAGTTAEFEFVFRTARDSVFRPEGVTIDRVRLERDGVPSATPSPPPASPTDAPTATPTQTHGPTPTASPSTATPTDGTPTDNVRLFLPAARR